MANIKHWGATVEEWVHFDLILGCTDKLLPVVCNPAATISPNSKMKALGKTPSLYNAQRHVVGFSNWVSKISTGVDIEKWMSEPDYGICIRTGHNEIAIDCDIEDADIQAKIQSIMLRSFGQIPPRRFRDNSNKCLYLIGVEGDYVKRVHRLEDNLGIIEFLAKGQQFIAAGTHPSGSRIQWGGGFPTEPFMVTEQQLNDFWNVLATELPVISSTESGRIGKARDLTIVTPNATDDIAEFLDSNGLTLDFGRNGERYITCPFAKGHSTDSGITSTAYFPKNTAGYEMGHFKCLHASCAHRNDGDFLNAIGFGVEDFEDLSISAKSEYLPQPPFTRDKNGCVEGTIANVLMALRRADLCGVQIRLDEFRNEIILTNSKGHNVQLRDEYYTKIHEKLEKELSFKKFQEADVKRAVRLVAYENRFDSLIDWVNSLPAWDGIPRVDNFFCRHWGIEESAYTKAVGRYWWTLLAGRALKPGIKGDMAVVLVSQQGKNKSEGIRAMAPTPDHYMELDFEKPSSERIREMRGHNVIELGEMRGMNKRGIGEVRVTISTRSDRNRGLYKEHYDELPRRCGFIGTANTDNPLTDTEGNRRWLPMTIPDDTDGRFIAPQIDNEKIQVWAEAVDIFKREGIAWEKAETLAKSILGSYEVRDEVWMSCISEWLETETTELEEDTGVKNYQRVPLTSKDLLVEAIGFKASQVKRSDEMKIAKIMKDLGYKKKQLQSIAGKPYHWEKCE